MARLMRVVESPGRSELPRRPVTIPERLLRKRAATVFQDPSIGLPRSFLMQGPAAIFNERRGGSVPPIRCSLEYRQPAFRSKPVILELRSSTGFSLCLELLPGL